MELLHDFFCDILNRGAFQKLHELGVGEKSVDVARVHRVHDFRILQDPLNVWVILQGENHINDLFIAHHPLLERLNLISCLSDRCFRTDGPDFRLLDFDGTKGF